MELNTSFASQAYAQAREAASASAKPQDTEGQSGSFADLAQAFVRDMTQAEQTVKQGLVGRADPQAVVEALAATEIAVQTAVTVRDRVVEAYQEILRMPV